MLYQMCTAQLRPRPKTESGQHGPAMRTGYNDNLWAAASSMSKFSISR